MSARPPFVSTTDGDLGVPVLVFARAPVAGQCKTRLIPAYGALGAVRIHRALLQRSVAVALNAGCGPVQLWSASRGRHPVLQSLARGATGGLRHQCAGDLGRRMAQALNSALRAGYRAALLIGTDTVELSAEDLRGAAHRLLDGADAVLQPATDGGYVMIGTRRALPGVLRGIEWSSGRELDQTCARLRQHGWRITLQPPRADIDHPADVRRARRQGWDWRQEAVLPAAPSRPTQSLLQGAPS
ncbi:TIGR04282 family arsenosugar biosynthesis glycosyltransferase [Panacagrimonas sp.]|uniref:TIGR04282 family arsenosugar biosynthesis glycosyltransferase n=1 Tax=Panacagrimonas sp. TaxID=2480088 RepID=UPI003B5178F5